MIKHKLIYLFILILGINQAGAQEQDIINVDLYTGTGMVNIPVYDYSVDGLSLNVSLNYLARGIRVDQVSSSAGLGWELSAGGYIARKVNGIEDEVTMPAVFKANPADPLEGFLAPGANNTKTIPPSDNEDDIEPDLFFVNIGGRNFSFAYSATDGKFISDHGDKYTIVANTYNWDQYTDAYSYYGNIYQDSMGIDSTRRLINFTIYDRQGNTYYFQRGDYQHKEFELNGSLFQDTMGIYYPTEKWDLKTIVTNTGKIITYEYVKSYVAYEESMKEVFNTRDAVVDYNLNSVIYDPFEVKAQYWKGVKTHLKKISYPNGISVIFDLSYDASSRCDCKKDFRLDKIILKQGIHSSNAEQIEYILKHNYFSSPVFGQSPTPGVYSGSSCNFLTSWISIPGGQNATDVANRHLSRGVRLKLTDIDRYSSSSQTTEKYYHFVYNDRALPYRLSPQKDWWGFYNNGINVPYVREGLLSPSTTTDTIRTAIPYHEEVSLRWYYPTYAYTLTSWWGQDREPNDTFARACILTDIYNRSGGRSTLEYGSYSLSTPDSAYYSVELTEPSGYINTYDIDTSMKGRLSNDGLVVTKVTHQNVYAAVGTVYTTYTYTNGQRFNNGGYLSYLDNGGKRVYTSTFLGYMDFYNGCNHGFSNAQVEVATASEELSDTRYSFTNLTYTGTDGKLKTCIRRNMYHSFAPSTLEKHRMGLILKEEHYDDLNHKTSGTETYYEYINSAGTLGSELHAQQNNADRYHPYTLLNNNFSRPTAIKSYKLMDNPSRELSKVENFIYDQRNNVVCKFWYDDARAAILKSYTHYNYHYHSKYNASTVTVPVVKSMDSLGLEVPLSTELWKYNNTQTDSTLLSLSIMSPQIFGGNKYRFPASFSLYNNGPVSSTSAWMSVYRQGALNNSDAATGFSKSAEVTRYDATAEPVETLLEDRATYNSTIIDSLTRQTIAEVRNARYDEIAFTSFEYLHGQSATGPLSFGNWIISHPGSVTSSGVMTGKAAYQLYSSRYIKSPALREKKYIVSFWVKTQVSGGIPTNQPSVTRFNSGNQPQSGISPQRVNNVGDWFMYTAVFDADSGDYISISNTASPSDAAKYLYMDEMRLHPADATMKSYTYIALQGKSSFNNENGYITYYNYDGFGRVSAIRDMRGKIIKKWDTSFQSSDSGNSDPNEVGTAPGGNQ